MLKIAILAAVLGIGGMSVSKCTINNTSSAVPALIEITR